MKKYEDIISLPHHVSDHHPQMSIHDRAAQFSPFAALTGYGDAVEETARLTSQKKILDETEREALDRQLASLAGLLEESRKADGRRGRRMKLLNVPGCLFPGTGGNVKEQTMIVEEQGIGFRTGVRFPSGPRKRRV